MRPIQQVIDNKVYLDALQTTTDFASTKSLTMCRHKWTKKTVKCVLLFVLDEKDSAIEFLL